MTFSIDSLITQKGRLLATIHETAKWGAKGVWGTRETETGVCRLALSDLDKQVRDWFVKETKSLGCEVKIDQVGNIFAIFPGKNQGKPTGIGSHLDTQPNGGRYDGILGVLSGLEVLRTFKENNYVPNYPIALVNWTNEEGARFPKSMVASGVWAKQIPLQECLNLKSLDKVPVSFGAELKRIGYDGQTKASYLENPLAAHFEIHIEQGPILENEGKKIGVVTGVQAFEWNLVTVKGRSSHAGTTPMNTRSDAILTASRVIVMAVETALKHQGLATVGTLQLEPGSVNVIPNIVKFSLDVRHVEDEILATIMAEIKQKAEQIAQENVDSPHGKPLSIDFENITSSKAIKFNNTNIKTVKDAASQIFKQDEIREITSGAGHDSCFTSTRVPTSMIFIPSKNGISHSPEEYSSPEEVENGFQVLLRTIVLFDEMRALQKA
ncbi:uncharacterized protein SPAPADRAFT_60114 [Spathaspora passalidarum NRRL Y-27907]|uniref:Peptidase M20 dimerisation domain-containing protein n=1 Tax=Spathaspora passalidarum (strain NRRL Y-27907 / 11-Y1) TaxID=619300 RepID=G3AM60_SPAPN|nr:uncharacterized protein SPAPADRAFT_60114 [Spathaspora passalidarum NRRL Y-27907]EGW32765.1 hypothetical protein SPAPADRAFT_60114 [Spathaspora passalidarum NRRL Y-27907]